MSLFNRLDGLWFNSFIALCFCLHYRIRMLLGLIFFFQFTVSAVNVAYSNNFDIVLLHLKALNAYCPPPGWRWHQGLGLTSLLAATIYSKLYYPVSCCCCCCCLLFNMCALEASFPIKSSFVQAHHAIQLFVLLNLIRVLCIPLVPL